MKNEMPPSSSSNNNNQNHYYLVKAQLPNQQRTTVSIPAGMTIREALGKALKLRKLEPDMCTVYRIHYDTNSSNNNNHQSDQHVSQQPSIKQKIDWDVDVAMLKGDEILVETKDRVPMHTQLSHNFAKSYLTLSKCHFCQEFLMTGIRCLTCGIEFHRNCASSVPKLCEPAIEHSNYYRHLLAREKGFSPTQASATIANGGPDSPTNTMTPKTIRPRARSADENSKHKSKLNNQNNNNSNNHNNSNNGTTEQHHSSTTKADATANQSLIAGNTTNSSSNHHQTTNFDYQQHSIYSQSTSPSTSHQYSNDPTSNHRHLYNQHLQPHLITNVNQHNSNINNENARQLSTPHREQLQVQQLSPVNQHANYQQQQQQLSNRELLEEKWEIDGNEVTKGSKIGQGSFATVYAGNWHGPVALKELNVKNPTPEQLQGYILKPELMIVTQWCKGRSLYKHLHVEERKDFTNCEIKAIAIGVAQGMEYLHAKNILHRDLKSNNIFIHDDNDLTVKIGDFGLATFKTRWEGNQQIYQPTGSILWMAPEIIRTKPGQNPFTFHSDVYSYGIVLYELLSRKLPYFDMKQKESLFFLIGMGGERTPKLNLNVIGPDKPGGMRALMLECIEREPSDRPLFTSIIRDLKKIKLSRIPRSTSEPLRLNDLNGSLAMDTIN